MRVCYARPRAKEAMSRGLSLLAEFIARKSVKRRDVPCRRSVILSPLNWSVIPSPLCRWFAAFATSREDEESLGFLLGGFPLAWAIRRPLRGKIGDRSESFFGNA